IPQLHFLLRKHVRLLLSIIVHELDSDFTVLPASKCYLILAGRASFAARPPVVYSFTNSFQSTMPWALRMSAVTGNSFGARGTLSSFKPASCGSRLPFFAFTALSDQTRFPHSSLPPRERGRTWSRLPSSVRSNLPVYWQRLPVSCGFDSLKLVGAESAAVSASRMSRERSAGESSGLLARLKSIADSFGAVVYILRMSSEPLELKDK